MHDESVWKRRFLLLTLARLFGLIVFFLGVAIAYSDLLREGGWPAVGAVFIIMGALDAVFAPKLLRKLWMRQDAERSGEGK